MPPKGGTTNGASQLMQFPIALRACILGEFRLDFLQQSLALFEYNDSFLYKALGLRIMEINSKQQTLN